MMTMPGIGPVVALTVRSTIDDPGRFRRSKDVGPSIGLTPRRYQSGETDIIGGVTKAGDLDMRNALYQAATVVIHRSKKPTWLRAWAERVVRRRGAIRAAGALARRMGVILHRMWVDNTEFQAARQV